MLLVQCNARNLRKIDKACVKLFLKLSTGNNLSNLSSITKTPPGNKGTPKEQKQFSSSKQIDPAWLAQTKLETANMVNANKILVRIHRVFNSLQ